MVTVAQIGVGYWGPNLLRNLMASPRCRVKTVVDLSSQRRRYVQQQFPGVATEERYQVVLSDPEVEAVVIATPAGSHYEISMAALTAGKHVLVEKPMATSSMQVGEIGNASRRWNLVAMVGHTFLFNPAVRYVKSLIDSGVVGQVRYIYSHRLNLGRIRDDVDALWNLAPHDVSIIQYWLGEPTPNRVVRTGLDFVQPGVEDVAFLSIEYPNRRMAHIHVSWLDPHKVRTMTVVGTKKMVVYDDIADKKVAIYDKGIDLRARLGDRMDYDQAIEGKYVHRDGAVEYPVIEWREPIQIELDHFLDCVELGTPCLTDAKHAEKVVRILEGYGEHD